MEQQKPKLLLITCEHAVNTIPERYKTIFETADGLLNTHRGIDFGSDNIARHLSRAFNCKLFTAETSRLLIDFNRSLGHSNCFSEISRELAPVEKERIINDYYLSYRNAVKEYLSANINKGFQVIHLSIHSFTPILHDAPRQTEFGLLYDPKRASEKAIARAWQREFRKLEKEWRIRLNYPYKGTADGFTTALRRDFDDMSYIGIEVECNQALTQNESSLRKIRHLLEKSLRPILP